jgi:integrase
MSASKATGLRRDAPNIFSKAAENKRTVRSRKVRYKDSVGVWRWKWLAPCTLEEAKRQREDLNVSVRRGEVVISGEAKTWRDVRAEWEGINDLRRFTAKNRTAIFRNHCQSLERLNVRDISKVHLLGLVARAKNRKTGGPLDEGTRAQILFAISAVFEYAVDAGYVARNPVHDLSKKQRPRQGEGRKRIVSQDEEDRLWHYSARLSWLRPLMTVALHQALRLGEAAGLQVEDVDFAKGKVHVRRALARDGQLGPCKGQSQDDYNRGVGRVIDLMPAARVALQDEIGGRTSGFVFLNRNGNPRNLRDIGRAFDKVVSRAALPVTENGKVTFHSLRHTGISRLANHRKIPLVQVRDFAGHKNLSTTETYVHKIENPEVTAAMAEAMTG